MKIITLLLISTAFAIDALRYNVWDASNEIQIKTTNISSMDWKAAKADDLPYFATIGANARDGKTKRICAGAIISEVSVLTSAHCGEVCIRPKNCVIFVGRIQACSDGQQLKIAEIIRHEPHDLKKGVDIAIFRTEPINFLDNFVQPIELADRDLTGKIDVYIGRWNHPESTVLFNQY